MLQEIYVVNVLENNKKHVFSLQLETTEGCYDAKLNVKSCS